MNFVTGYSRSQKYTAIWVIVDRFNKCAHLIPISVTYGSDKPTTRVRHPIEHQFVFQPQTDGQLKRTIQTLEDMLRAIVLDRWANWESVFPLIEFAYKTTATKPLSAWLRLKCCMEKDVDHHSIGTKLVKEEEMIEIGSKIRERIKKAQDRQKSHADI